MRQRLRPFRARVMARRPNGARRFTFTRRTRRIAGWVAAIAIIGAIAIFGFILGGDGDGTGAGSSSSASATPGDVGAIRFGTALDPATGEVAADAETARFVETDLFVYSYRPTDPPPTTIWVEVRRNADGSGESVQEPSGQELADDSLVIAFEVGASRLFEDFEPGTFQMRISLTEDAPAVAVGTFELVTPAPSGSP